MSDDSDFGAFLVGFIVGGLAGAAAALLLAPQSGEETRAYIKDRSIELKDKAVETMDEARARTEVALDDAKARARTESAHAMGLPDLYPFVLGAAAVAKLSFMHSLIKNVGAKSPSTAKTAARSRREPRPGQRLPTATAKSDPWRKMRSETVPLPPQPSP